MESNEVTNAFNALRSIIDSADLGTRRMLPSIAGRLRLSGAGYNWDEKKALSALKRELRGWDIAKGSWKPR